jgi:hypothetical protein
MEKLINNKVIEETKEGSKGQIPTFEVPGKYVEKPIQEFGDLASKIDHDGVVTTETLSKIDDSLNSMFNDLDSDLNLKENLRIWKNIREGHLDKDEISKMTILPKDVAEIILNVPDNKFSPSLGYSLTGIKNLDEDVAKLFVGYGGRNVWLNGLTHISDETALYLSQCKGELEFEGLESLSDNAAKHLFADHQKEITSFKKMVNISDTAIGYLLECLSRVDPKYLYLSLPSLPHISDTVADQLSVFKGNHISLGIARLSDPAAQSLSKFKGSIYFENLSDVSDEAIKHLAHLAGGLSLEGLDSITEQAAEYLSTRKRGLKLSVSHLSDSSAENLSKIDGTLTMTSLKSITPRMAKSFSKHKGVIDLGITEITDELARILSVHEDTTGLTRLKYLSDSAAEYLSKHKNGKLHLSWDTEMSDAAKDKLEKSGASINGGLLLW